MGGAYDDIKKDFKHMYKHAKKGINGFFKGMSRGDRGCDRNNGCNNYGNFHGHGGRPPLGGWWYPPFLRPNSPWIFLFYPKIAVAIIILITLLLCGVSLYGLIVIFLLAVVFILI